MPMLEEGFERLYWPPLVKEAKIIHSHPGYEYIKFKNYQELDAHFSAECGPNWRTQEWAKYWIGQHEESKRKDQRERNQIKPRNKQVMESLYEISKMYLENNPFLSSRKLAYIMNRSGNIIGHMTASKFIKRFKNEKD